LAQWRVQWLVEHSTSHQLLWCIDSFVLLIPPLRQAANRYWQFSIDYRDRQKFQNQSQDGDDSTGDYMITVAPVDASYLSSYSFSAEMATTIKTKIVPIPPPVALEERVRQLTEQSQDGRDEQTD